MKSITKHSVCAVAALMALGMSARDAEGIKIYINPGHGGHESNDRNVVIAPYTSGDPNGYWESNSNLSKGLQLRDMLEAKGYTVVMSRTLNRTEDDLGLSTIVQLCNESGADLFFSIHSNATGTGSRRNFPLMLYRGYDNDPIKPNDLKICQILNAQLLENQATYWTSTSTNCRGDWSFYPSWGTSGLGVLRGNNTTAMLSEGSFHDYIPETYRLMSDDFCWLEAWHFRKAVDEFFGVEGLKVGAICGRLNDNRVPTAGSYITFGDDKFAPVNGAKVELLDAAGNVVQTYVTDPVHNNGFYLFKDLQPGEYKVRSSVDTHMPAESDVIIVTADNVSYCNLKMAKVRNTPPKVESYSPVWTDGQDGVLCNTPIVIQFNWDMDTESVEKAFSTTPATTGSFTWEDLNYRMVYTPDQAYDTNTEYTVNLDASAMHAGGVPMQESFSFKFMTSARNYMSILGAFPKNDEPVHYKNAAVEFRFDKLPLMTNIIEQITCTDSEGNTVKFNKRGLKNSKAGDAYGWFRIPFLSSLTVGKTYKVRLDGSFSDKDGITIQGPVEVEFKAVDAGSDEGKTDSKILCEVESIDNFAYDSESSADCTTATVTKSTDALYGSAAVALNYTFTSDETEGEVRFGVSNAENTNADPVTVAPGQILGVHVNGDLTANNLYLELTSDVSTINVPVCQLDFLGWRYIEVPATVEGVSTLTGVKVVQETSQISQKGTVGLDNVIVKSDDAGVSDIVAAKNITVYPNPASEYLIANADSFILKVELVGLNGEKIAEAGGNILNVSDISDGTYLMLVSTADTRTVHKVIVKH